MCVVEVCEDGEEGGKEWREKRSIKESRWGTWTLEKAGTVWIEGSSPARA